METLDVTSETFARLAGHQAALEALGVRHIAVFGSVARGEAGPGSDVDVYVELDQAGRPRGLAYFGLLERLKSMLGDLLDQNVDLVTAPVSDAALAARIDKEARRVF
jgi:predicted nucleotidyltransferase